MLLTARTALVWVVNLMLFYTGLGGGVVGESLNTWGANIPFEPVSVQRPPPYLPLPDLISSFATWVFVPFSLSFSLRKVHHPGAKSLLSPPVYHLPCFFMQGMGNGEV